MGPKPTGKLWVYVSTPLPKRQGYRRDDVTNVSTISFSSPILNPNLKYSCGGTPKTYCSTSLSQRQCQHGFKQFFNPLVN